MLCLFKDSIVSFVFFLRAQSHRDISKIHQKSTNNDPNKTKGKGPFLITVICNVLKHFFAVDRKWDSLTTLP